MNEEGKEAIKELKHYVNITPHWKFKEYTFSELDYYIKTTLNYIEKLQKVIDLMATELSRRPLMIYLDDERDDRLVILDNPKEIIKYYTKKAEEEK